MTSTPRATWFSIRPAISYGTAYSGGANGQGVVWESHAVTGALRVNSGRHSGRMPVVRVGR